ncbi:response regulator [Pseudomonas sp. TCU-HL1]|uniref:response regulator n=1 Tax=Pseudomonas sp. TCU-HL1 TaxID=1856685 RepID=UPI00083D30AF|nr:response regulator [Pseudomonas sp. TCU-HL1]AOE83774.1 histidine kinase [Pseudomonas sp. TCU-HL1]
MTSTASDPLATPPAQAPQRRWWQQWLVAVCLAALLGAANLVALHAYFQEDARASRLAEEQAVLQQLSIVRAQLESYLNGDLYQVKGLIGLPMANPDIDERLFARIAAELAGNDQHIKSLQLAPDGIVTHVWPYESNKGAIGHDLLGDATRREAAQRAIDTRQLWVAGPVKLIQGGTAIIGRYPIFVNDDAGASVPERFWGFATVLIDWHSIVERARQAAGDAGDIEIAIRGKDGLGADGEQLYGQPEVFTNAPITMDVVLPGGVWQLAGVPASGWLVAGSHRLELRVLFYALALLLAGGFYALLRLPARLRRMVDEATDNLRCSENRLVDAIEAIPDAFAIFDAEDRLALCNANFRRTYPLSAPAIRAGNSASNIIQYGIEQGQFAAVEGAKDMAGQLGIKLDQHVRGESYEEQLSDGRVLRVIQRRMRDGGLAGIRVDISDLKAKQRELAEAKRRADASNEAKSAFLATVSHELRTPLNVVIGILSAFESSPRLSFEERGRLSVANRSGKHLLSLVNEILDLARIESGQLELEVAPFRVLDLVKPVLNYAESSCERKGLAFDYQAGAGLPLQCLGDAVRLRQILFNLLSNAVKFTAAGLVRLSVVAAPAAEGRLPLRFCVDDSGPGIEPARRGQLFEAFAQGDDSLTREHNGVGLGLAISRRLARMMGGDIEIDDSPLGGARFIVTLPLDCADADPVESQDSTSATYEQASRRILVVDDSPSNQLVIECLLEGLGHELHYADSGAQAIELVQQRPFDLILMDISMPQMTGVEATRHIRTLLGERCPRVVAVTAHTMEGDRERYLADGLDGFIAKPIDKPELLQAIAECRPSAHYCPAGSALV